MFHIFKIVQICIYKFVIYHNSDIETILGEIFLEEFPDIKYISIVTNLREHNLIVKKLNCSKSIIITFII